MSISQRDDSIRSSRVFCRFCRAVQTASVDTLGFLVDAGRLTRVSTELLTGGDHHPYTYG
ncbi:Uncharacterised protein [Mycobacteroides abscessus subsp. abscessus]|nr:Uncharacterised protein [Mycobacteroides abscessus subsp. abscessus]